MVRELNITCPAGIVLIYPQIHGGVCGVGRERAGERVNLYAFPREPVSLAVAIRL